MPRVIDRPERISAVTSRLIHRFRVARPSPPTRVESSGGRVVQVTTSSSQVVSVERITMLPAGPPAPGASATWRRSVAERRRPSNVGTAKRR
jgi:hypothetical protein